VSSSGRLTVERFAQRLCCDGHLIAPNLQTKAGSARGEGAGTPGVRTKLTSPPDSHTASAPTTAMSHLRVNGVSSTLSS